MPTEWLISGLHEKQMGKPENKNPKKALAKTRFQIINGTFIYKHVYFIHHYFIASKMT